STPDYTRVAIDVEQEVKFGSQRISNPDRIFFDLHDTKLASTLVGKTFDVDDGFLKKIRVAEYQPGRTRIVLEVDDLASYDAFLLPDPYRLIIDIHGKDAHGSDAHGKAKRSNPSLAELAKANADTALAASADAEDESGEAETSGEAKRDNRKAATGNSKPGPVETDLPAADASADSQPVANRAGVIKTTVTVKGTNRRIPKTIVEADDRAPSKPGRLESEKRRREVKPSQGAENSGDDRTTVAKADLAAPGSSLSSSSSFPSSSLSSSSSSSSSRASSSSGHRRKSGTAVEAADTGDLHTGANLEAREAAREARPTAAGDRSLTRALGLKIGKIVIDAGHGGHDTGTIGPNGLLEKDVVLDVAKRLGRLLESRLGAEVIYTRQDDTFIPLETRTAIANRERADLFISVHANSSRDADARGVETYYLNFTSSPEALEVAARENAVSEKSIHELQDLVKKIALKEKIEESREFAGDVQESLYGGLALNNAGIRNRGIKKAPFIVLIGANMPSILAEISFVSNPTDERKMETSEHRQRIAESLYRGVSKYVNGLSGVKVASKIDKPEGQ
ncbi:MAG: N-acetylmuramoyl-L-alanine amidase, partial [Terriglobales bacterium]